MSLIVRQEKNDEIKLADSVVERAFKDEIFSNHTEHFLTARLRKSEDFIPQLSLVAELEGEIIGHIMFSRLTIESIDDSVESLALSPVSVLPQYQREGVGSKLIVEGLRKAKELGYKSVIVLGHDNYYPRFGFKAASKWGIRATFDVPDELFMALELEIGGLHKVNGVVLYPPEFYVD